ncbi:MAG: hypothetical protein PF440_03725 [Thiomicrorhabdus sp.]|jgi:hypothetical protein|nr:hypothetical protein [Thiomicrorhabdus sp.]
MSKFITMTDLNEQVYGIVINRKIDDKTVELQGNHSLGNGVYRVISGTEIESMDVLTNIVDDFFAIMVEENSVTATLVDASTYQCMQEI